MRDEVTGVWKELHNEELHNLYSSPSMIRMIKSMRMRWAYSMLEGKRPLQRPSHWSSLGCRQMEGSCESDYGPSSSMKCWEVLEWSSAQLTPGNITHYII
jgi:hypothetical protein